MFNKLGGTVLFLVGLFITLVIGQSSLEQGMDWFLRTGYEGLAIGLLMLSSGIYSFLNMPYNLVVRTLWSIGFLIALPFFALLTVGMVADGGMLGMIVGSVLTAIIYIPLLGSTALELWQKF